MSSWFPDSVPKRAAWLLGCLSLPAMAADVQYAPLGEARVEYNTNRELNPLDESGSEGYVAEVGALIKIATPRSTTTLKPVIGYVDFPDSDERSLNGAFDFNSQLQGLRYRTGIYGRFEVQDTFSSELAPPEFNPVNPDLPTTPETGRISTDRKRTLLTVVPSYSYSLTQRTDLVFTGVVQTVDYSGASTGFDYIPFSHFNLKTGLGWELSPKTDLSIGVFVTRTDNKDDDGEAEAVGVSAGYDYEWSPRMSSRLEVLVEQDDITTVLPVASSERSTNAGATYNLRFTGEISRLDLNIGRTFTPSGFGGTSKADQLQVELRRSLSERTEFSAAARYIRYGSLSEAADSGYDYVNAGVRLSRQLTRTWFLAGSVNYWREDYGGATGTADNVQAGLSIGYQGLQR